MNRVIEPQIRLRPSPAACRLPIASPQIQCSVVTFRQFFDAPSCAFTYLLGSGNSREALIINSVKEQTRQYYLLAIEQLGLRLVQPIDTRTHADHIAALGDQRDATGCVSRRVDREGNAFHFRRVECRVSS